jgi:hypothetical protein
MFNPTGDGQKPYEFEVASPRSGTVMGRGIIEPIIEPCRGINTAINQTFDSQTLANSPSLLFPEESEAASVLSSGFFPGIPVPYKETPDEIGILKFPEPTGSSFQTIGFFQSIIERLTRTPPSRLGEISEGRRVPATLGLSSQQIGAELTDEMIDRIRDTTGRIMDRSFILYWKSDPLIFSRVLGQKRGELLRRVIEKSIHERRSISEALRVRLAASSATRSRELERQNAIATASLTQSWYQQVIQLVTFYAQVPPGDAQAILLDILKGSETQMRRLVELSNQPDPENIVPLIADRLEAAARAQTAAPGAASTATVRDPNNPQSGTGTGGAGPTPGPPVIIPEGGGEEA